MHLTSKLKNKKQRYYLLNFDSVSKQRNFLPSLIKMTLNVLQIRTNLRRKPAVITASFNTL